MILRYGDPIADAMANLGQPDEQDRAYFNRKPFRIDSFQFLAARETCLVIAIPPSCRRSLDTLA